MNDITPVFILGNNRSGTTFLGNLIADNFEVATLSHPLHFGILESNIYSYKHYLGDFSDIDNYLKAISILSESDLYLASGLSKAYFLENRASSFYDLFLQLMDELAIREKKPRWITKLDPMMYSDPDELQLFINLVNSRYENVDFISIKRNYTDYIRSVLQLGGKKVRDINGGAIRRNIFICHRTALFFHNNRVIDDLVSSESGLEIDFDYFVSNSDLIKIEIGKKFGFEFKEDTLESVRLVNASQKSGDFSGSLAIRIWRYVLSSSPLVSSFCAITANKIYRFKSKSSPLWWRLAKKEYFHDELVDELSSLNQTALIDNLELK